MKGTHQHDAGSQQVGGQEGVVNVGREVQEGVAKVGREVQEGVARVGREVRERPAQCINDAKWAWSE